MKIVIIPVLLVAAVAAFLPCMRAHSDAGCTLPAAPANGEYKVNRLDELDPTKTYEFLALNYSCNPGYETTGNKVRLCIKGTWSSDEPQCVRMCELVKIPSVEYVCVVKGGGIRECMDMEPEGTLVRPKCQANYYFVGDLPNMRCVDGKWDYCPTCLPECGIFPTDELSYRPWFTPSGMTRVPWFATIYKKSTTKAYLGWCSGTLVSKKAVLTAAHCFWDRQIKKASLAKDFAVAVGKMLYGWNAAEDANAQKSDVAEIIIHPEYPLESTKESQGDIAVITLMTEVQFSPAVRPACLDFDNAFEQQQFETTKGLYVSWIPVEGDQTDRSLIAFSLPYMPTQECYPIFREDIRKYITSDKICVGISAGTLGTCRVGLVRHGNTGGGIAFPEQHRGVKRYYLRGIVTLTASYAPCINGSLGIFTHITKHENFIKELI